MAQDSEHQGASHIGVNEPFFSADYNTPISREQPFTGNTPLSRVRRLATDFHSHNRLRPSPKSRTPAGTLACATWEREREFLSCSNQPCV